MERHVEESVRNPIVITVVGMGVVMATLAVLWFIARVVSFAVQLATRAKKPSDEAGAIQVVGNEASSAVRVAEQPPQGAGEVDEGELVVVLAAAATAVLGAPVRVLAVQPQDGVAIQTGYNGWVAAARSEQVRSFNTGYGTR